MCNGNLLYWEIKRRQIDYDQIPQMENFGYVASTETVIVHDLSPELQSRVEQLKPEQRQRMFSTLKNRNGMVVEFNPTATTLLGCNTNYSFLGSHAQSLASLYYVLKYLTKSPTEAAHCLVLYHNARKIMDPWIHGSIPSRQQWVPHTKYSTIHS